MSPLDGREPFSLDIADLGRRAGAMMKVTRTSSAPGDLRNAVIEVPVGSDIDLDLMAESVIEGVLVTGTASVHAEGSCSRCLDPVEDLIDVDIQELFRYDDAEQDPDDEEDLPVLEGDIVDLEPTLRDAVVLALPLTPVCRDDCPGLCSECGARLADDPDHHHDSTDPRWAALAGVFGDEAVSEARPQGASSETTSINKEEG